MSTTPIQAGIKIFLSCVSTEFESYRVLLAQDLNRPNVEVKIQENFIGSGHTTLEKIDDYIKSCDAVIHLVGDATGSIPPLSAVQKLLGRYQDRPNKLAQFKPVLESPQASISYTQWEAYLAIYHEKPCHIYRAVESAPRGDRYVPDDLQKKCQQEHYDRLTALGRDRARFGNPDRLSNIVLRDLVDLMASASRLSQTNFLGGSPYNIFIGRRTEIDAAIKKLSQGRILTLTGPGGVGKSHLGYEVAQRVQAQFPDGACRIDLSTTGAVSLEEAVIPMVDRMVNPPRNQVSPERKVSLAELVGDRRILLFLDNFELHAREAGKLSLWLNDCPNLRLIISSRVRTDQPTEVILNLSPLELPDTSIQWQSFLDAPSMRLFIERANATGEEFSLNEATANAVARICRLIDGMPLAILLVASRAVMVGLPETELQLQSRRELLVQGRQLHHGSTNLSNAPPQPIPAFQRHESMELALQWSYQLLDEEDRELLGRVAVFSGGFTLASAAKVANVDQHFGVDLSDKLRKLTSHSWLTARRLGDSQVFGSLDSIREFLAERTDSFIMEDVRRWQIRWLLTAQGDRQLGVKFSDDQSADEASWQQMLRNNLEEAAAWAAAHADKVLADQLSDLRRAMRHWELLALLARNKGGKTATEPSLLEKAGQSRSSHRFAEAAVFAGQFLEQAVTAKDPVMRFNGHYEMSLIELLQEHTDASLLHARQAIEAAQQSGDDYRIYAGHFLLGSILGFKDPRSAIAEFQSSQTMAREGLNSALKKIHRVPIVGLAANYWSLPVGSRNGVVGSKHTTYASTKGLIDANEDKIWDKLSVPDGKHPHPSVDIFRFELAESNHQLGLCYRALKLLPESQLPLLTAALYYEITGFPKNALSAWDMVRQQTDPNTDAYFKINLEIFRLADEVGDQEFRFFAMGMFVAIATFRPLNLNEVLKVALNVREPLQRSLKEQNRPLIKFVDDIIQLGKDKLSLAEFDQISSDARKLTSGNVRHILLGTSTQTAAHQTADRLAYLAQTYMELGLLKESLVVNQASLVWNAKGCSGNNNYAWLLATCSNDSIRDGKTAILHAQRACDVSERKTWQCLGTLSAAYAEAGDFAQALKSIVEAISVAPPENHSSLKQMKALFEANQAIRL